MTKAGKKDVGDERSRKRHRELNNLEVDRSGSKKLRSPDGMAKASKEEKMKKKKKKKKTTKGKEEAQKPLTDDKDMGTATSVTEESDAIDDIFSTFKRDVVKAKAAKARKSAEAVPRVQKHPPVDDMGFTRNSIVNKGTGRRYTDDGLPIYTEEELKVGQGGGTPDCPWDCNCCF